MTITNNGTSERNESAGAAVRSDESSGAAVGSTKAPALPSTRIESPALPSGSPTSDRFADVRRPIELELEGARRDLVAANGALSSLTTRRERAERKVTEGRREIAAVKSERPTVELRVRNARADVDALEGALARLSDDAGRRAAGS